MSLRQERSYASTIPLPPTTEPPAVTPPPPEGYTFDSILDHPRWMHHAQLEREMLTAGVERYRKNIQEARDDEEMTRLRPYRRLLEELLGKLAQGVEMWKVEKKKHRARPVAYKLLKNSDAAVLALLTLRAVIDRLSSGTGLQLMSVASLIGLSVEHEERAAMFIEHKPELWHTVQNGLDRQHATAQHRERVNVNRFSKLVAGEIGWQDWTHDQRIRVGLQLIDILVTYTRRFTIEADPNGTRGKMRKPLALVPDPKVVAWLTEGLDRDEVMFPLYMPMLVPPRRWTTPRDGGYWTPLVVGKTMIRFKANYEEQRNRALDDISAVDMPEVYTAINAIQEVPWRINARILDVAIKAWERDLAVAGMPLQERTPLPPKPSDMDDNEEARRTWKRAAAEIYGSNARRVSHTLSAKRCLLLAERFRNETFYFPHVLDFRGRMYPIPPTLNPQGADLARAMLTFAEGKPLDDRGKGWLTVHLANCFGIDKVGFAERVDWVYEREDMWRRINDAPLLNRDWCKADKPWQALAAIFEWVAATDHGEGYVSSLPVSVDGTCNGIQHLSAMLRDEKGGAAVNLIDGPEPRDIYREVATLLTGRLRTIETGGGDEGTMARRWLQFADPDLPRAVTKRPVMILPYGGTIDAYQKYTMEWLGEADPHAERIGPAIRYEAVRWLCRHLWTTVKEVVVGGAEIMRWLRLCARAAAKSGAPLLWVTPAGFVVRHFYGKRRKVMVESRIDGQRVSLVDWKLTAELETKDQFKGIAPNYVHSMDAASLMLSINLAFHNDIRQFTAVHDAYGTVAADMDLLNACLRAGFVQTYEAPVLEQFRDACLHVTRSDQDREAMPPVPASGSLDIAGVLDSAYFFG